MTSITRLSWLVCWLLACSTTALEAPPPVEAGVESDAGPGTFDAAPTLACEPERGLVHAVDVLAAANDPCRSWIVSTVGRATRVGGGSGSIWTRRTERGIGLMLTASHVLSRCTREGAPRDVDGNCPETTTEPKNGVTFLRLTEPGGVYASRSSSVFALYNNFMPASVISTPNLLPRHEVSLYVVDAPTFEPWDYLTMPEPVAGLLPLHDPGGLTLATPTWAEPESGARVLTLGYPIDNHQSDLVAGFGRVLDDDEVATAQQYLRERGDEEGSVPYEPAVEFFYRGSGKAGMSGGGTFDEAGRQVGMVVRASQLETGDNYVRVVRMSHVVASLKRGLAALPPAERARIEPYLEAP